MLRVALTGGIATGKSYCLEQFEKLGAAVIDADLLARDAVARDTPGLRAVVARFGQEILSADGSLNRAALARVVFADSRARGDLEAIIHPEVYQCIREWLANLGSGVRIAIADIPLLFESGHHHDYDRVVVAACEPPEQVRRMISRNGLTESEALARLAAQWPIGEKVARANYVIRTDASFAETDRQVKDVYERLLADTQ